MTQFDFAILSCEHELLAKLNPASSSISRIIFYLEFIHFGSKWSSPLAFCWVLVYAVVNLDSGSIPQFRGVFGDFVSLLFYSDYIPMPTYWTILFILSFQPFHQHLALESFYHQSFKNFKYPEYILLFILHHRTSPLEL